jgi:hypothetical protein
MITGAHVVLYSVNAETDRAFIRDVLGLAYVDAGDGWLIFQLPPAETAVHPAEAGSSVELYLLTDDLMAEVARLTARGVECASPTNAGWGLLTYLTLPSGARLGLYQPRHAQP